MSGLLGGDADSDSRPRSVKAATKAGRMMKREQEIIIVEMIYLVQWHWLLLRYENDVERGPMKGGIPPSS